MSVELVLWVLIVHWFADFVCQTDEVALNKSHSLPHLAYHSLIYAGVLFSFVDIYCMNMGIVISPLFFLNLPAHFIIDGITGRINARLYEKHRHWFFVSIGFDQFLHYTVLFLTI